MPEKEGAEEKTTKSVVNKKQKQMMGEEGYDVARDEGRVKPSKDKKDGTTMTPSKEMEKTRKLVKGKSALERVKADIEKRYGKGAIMDVKKKKDKKDDTKEELDLTKVAESFGGYLIEGEYVQDDPMGIYDFDKKQLEKIKKAERRIQGRAMRRADAGADEILDLISGKKKLTKAYSAAKDKRIIDRQQRKAKMSGKPYKAPEGGFKARSRYKNQPSLNQIKKEIDTREIITPDRRLKSSRVATSSPQFGRSTVPKTTKPPIKLTKPSDVELPQGFKDFDRKLKSTRQSFARQRVGKSSRATRNVIKNLTKGGKTVTPVLKTGTKATVKTIGKVGGKQLAKTGVKIGAKALGKTALKQIPFLGQAIAGAEAVGRLATGDAVGAGIALASAIPGIGIGADAANAARDIRRATKLARKAKTLTKVTRTGKTIQGANVIKRFKRSKMSKVPKVLQTKKGKLAAQVGGAIAVPTAGGLIKRALGGAKASGDAVGHVGRRTAG